VSTRTYCKINYCISHFLLNTWVEIQRYVVHFLGKLMHVLIHKFWVLHNDGKIFGPSNLNVMNFHGKEVLLSIMKTCEVTYKQRKLF
jgi:hypothetical protein